MIISVIC